MKVLKRLSVFKRLSFPLLLAKHSKLTPIIILDMHKKTCTFWMLLIIG